MNKPFFSSAYWAFTLKLSCSGHCYETPSTSELSILFYRGNHPITDSWRRENCQCFQYFQSQDVSIWRPRNKFDASSQPSSNCVLRKSCQLLRNVDWRYKITFGHHFPNCFVEFFAGNVYFVFSINWAFGELFFDGGVIIYLQIAHAHCRYDQLFRQRQKRKRKENYFSKITKFSCNKDFKDCCYYGF